MAHKFKKIFRPKKRYLTALLVLLLVALMATLELTNTTHLFHKQATISVAVPVKQPPSNSTNSGDKTPSSSISINKGTAVDNKGAISSVTTSSSSWAVSASGVITLKQPVSNDRIVSGVNLAGISTLNQVQYRLIDDGVGVISQGTISVVNGNFSANISFQAKSKTGRLDVFSSDSNGREINEVQVPVTF